MILKQIKKKRGVQNESAERCILKQNAFTKEMILISPQSIFR